MSERDMLGFLVQCVGAGEAVPPTIPTDPGSRCAEPSSVADNLAWRKHDWPDRRIAEAEPLGHQVSDSVLDRRFPFPLVVQTFDFGDSGRVFGRFDRGKGDGGDAATIVDGAAWIFFTEDGGAGQQWFVGEACRTDSRPEAARASWLAFGDDVTRGRWQERLARLNHAAGPDSCPTRFNDAYTRYRRDTIEVPFRFVSPKKPVTRSTVAVDTIVSEHFGGRDVAGADHLERFYFGRGLGKFRWERWENMSKTRRGEEASRAAKDFAESGRCPALAYSEPPRQGWVLTDCRTWTNLVRLTEAWSPQALDWPGEAFDPLRGGAGQRAR